MDLVEIFSWSSASGLARSLYVNKSWTRGCIGALARLLIVLLLLVPLTLGLAEITLGIIYRHQSESCPFFLPVWVLVDGSAALLTAILSLVDIARVQALSDSGDEEDAGEDADDSAEARARRQKALGTYACTGLTVIFLLPLFRLVWMGVGLEGLYTIDPASFSSGTNFFAGQLNPGSCNLTLYGFTHYYLEAATLIVLLLLIVLLVVATLILCTTAQSVSLGWCCSWCCCRQKRTRSGKGKQPSKGGNEDTDEEERLLQAKQRAEALNASPAGAAAAAAPKDGQAILISTGVAAGAAAVRR